MDEKDKTAKKDNNKVLLIASHFMVAVLIGIFAFTGISRSSSSIQARMAETLIQFSEFTAAAQSRNDEPAMEDADEPESSDKEEKETKSAAKDLDDGEYTGSAMGYGGQVTATVVIKDSVIESITVEGKNETNKYWVKANKIVNKMISKQTWDVDAVSGATLSSNGIRNSVKQALESAGMI